MSALYWIIRETTGCNVRRVSFLGDMARNETRRFCFARGEEEDKERERTEWRKATYPSGMGGLKATHKGGPRQTDQQPRPWSINQYWHYLSS